MKKEYISPVVQVINIETTSLMDVSKVHVGEATTGEDVAESNSYRNNLWN